MSLIVAACATTPPEPHTNEFAMIPAPAAPPRPEGAQTAAATIPLPEQPAEQPLITANDQYADLFQRLRAGYQFAPEENGPIDQQINFFVSKPDFLNRTFERGERYLYYVTTELEARHMPAELAMLPVIESSYNPYAYSRARAAGIWQFIAPTATRYQVRVNWWQDGRRDIVDSTRAALDYLEVLHQRFGDWLLAIAAYNCGEAAVQRAVDHNRDAGLPTTFWNLKLVRSGLRADPEQALFRPGRRARPDRPARRGGTGRRERGRTARAQPGVQPLGDRPGRPERTAGAVRRGR